MHMSVRYAWRQSGRSRRYTAKVAAMNPHRDPSRHHVTVSAIQTPAVPDGAIYDELEGKRERRIDPSDGQVRTHAPVYSAHSRWQRASALYTANIYQAQFCVGILRGWQAYEWRSFKEFYGDKAAEKWADSKPVPNAQQSVNASAPVQDDETTSLQPTGAPGNQAITPQRMEDRDVLPPLRSGWS